MKKFLSFTLVVILLVGMAVGGYIANIVKLCQCDFDTPLKAEVIRGIGVIVPPVGVVTGWLTIQDGKTEQGK